jgi:hypothetical protein
VEDLPCAARGAGDDRLTHRRNLPVVDHDC